jgi:hypothetical protein
MSHSSFITAALRNVRCRVAAIAGTAALVLLVCLSASAEAYIYAGGGYRGATNTIDAHCRYVRTNAQGYLTTSAAPPGVTGADLRAGWGNDWTWVRYRAYLVDSGGNTLQTSGWSGWQQVRDDQAARWSGVTSFSSHWSGAYRIDLRIEWWNSSSMIGWEAHRITRYKYFDMYNIGPYGPFSSCYKL